MQIFQRCHWSFSEYSRMPFFVIGCIFYNILLNIILKQIMFSLKKWRMHFSFFNIKSIFIWERGGSRLKPGPPWPRKKLLYICKLKKKSDIIDIVVNSARPHSLSLSKPKLALSLSLSHKYLFDVFSDFSHLCFNVSFICILWTM